MITSHLVLLLFSALLPVLHTQEPSLSPFEPPEDLFFEDVFEGSGLDNQAPPSLKFGGPCVADIDRDGVYDVILNFHNRNRTRIYLGRGDGTFEIFVDPKTRRPFFTSVLDVHGVAVGPISTKTRDRLISFSVGGGRGGTPRSPEIYLMTPERRFRDVTFDMGFGLVPGRARNTVFMDLQKSRNDERRLRGGGPDVLFLNFNLPEREFTQYAYGNTNGQYSLERDVGEFTRQRRGRVELTDINNDGTMELISIQEFRFYQLKSPFKFFDVTSQVIPEGFHVGFLTVTAVAELDYDNDGDFDLYIARADRSIVSTRGTLAHDDHSDLLLRNDGGKYTDVSEAALLPKGTNSLGVTTGDFNNDGYSDVFIVLYDEPDIVLLNRGDGTFEQIDNLIPKKKGSVGNHAVAVDFDMDGNVDLIVGHGASRGDSTKLGPFLLMKNRMATENNYLHVTVFNDPTGASTSLHAVVKIYLRGRRKLIQRVGSRGSQEAHGSYLDTVHFGLGKETFVQLVVVKWTSNIIEKKFRVDANQRVFFGKF